MLKNILLATTLLSACALEPDESTTELETGCESGCECTHDCEPPPPPPPGPSCDVEGGTVFLDDEEANVDNNDRKVTFCHATSSAKNPYVIITTSINACRAHQTHVHQTKGGHLDVFPTGGCAD